MNKQEYREYLKSDHWMNLKNKKFNSPNIKHTGKICEICGSNKNINVHHMEYKNIFDVRTHQLRIICKICHQIIHDHMNNYPKQKFCFAELQYIVKKIRKIPILFKKVNEDTPVRKLRSILKELGFKMCGLKHNKTVILCRDIGII